MRVKAKFSNGKYGFYGDRRRYDGDEFEITDPKHFSKVWMEKIEEAPRRGRKPAAEKVVEDAEDGAE